MAAFNLALTCIRDGADDLLLPERINQLALAQGHSFRNTTLTPGNTVRLFVQQVAHGNVACSAVRHLAGEDFSDSAWCQARSRLPMELIQQVHQDIVDQGRRELGSADDVGDASYRWRGHRLHVIDGSSDSMPDTVELRDHYGWLRLRDVSAAVELKVNPGRLEPRVIKRQKKEYPYMTRPRAVLKLQLREEHCVVA
jgi:hypothetical protein